MKHLLIVATLLFSVCAVAAPCHFTAAVELTPPYTGAHCPDVGEILWSVGYSPITKELYVLPREGELWNVSARPNEDFDACDDNGHCFVLHVKQLIISQKSKAIGVEFWGSAWK